MERDIKKAYTKYHCKECENRHTDSCSITVTEIDGIVIAKCPYYKNSKRKRRGTEWRPGEQEEKE